MLLKVAWKVVQYLGYFCSKIFSQELSKSPNLATLCPIQTLFRRDSFDFDSDLPFSNSTFQFIVNRPLYTLHNNNNNNAQTQGSYWLEKYKYFHTFQRPKFSLNCAFCELHTKCSSQSTHVCNATFLLRKEMQGYVRSGQVR